MRNNPLSAVRKFIPIFLASFLIASPSLVGNLIFPIQHGSPQSVSKYQKNKLHLKIDPASDVTLINGSFSGNPADQVTQLNQIISSGGKIKAEKLKNTAGQSDIAKKLDNALNGYFVITFKGDTDINSVISQLKGLSIVETAYGEPTAAPAPSSPSFVNLQSYLQTAPTGINSTSAKAYPGGNGSNVRIFDIEYSWNVNHEDITKARTALIANGTPNDPFSDNNHGTAVMGILVADDNAYGVTGAASGASLGLINVNDVERGYDPVGALSAAAAYAKPGDVINIDQQTWGPTTDTYDFVPVEWIPEVYDAIKTLTANGVIVVESAGNGYQNLDDPTYYGTSFPMGKADSDALIVGAGENCYTPKLSRISYSDYGKRVNLQGPGDCVATTGWYGDLYSAGGVNAYYTQSFNGTSSATPVVSAAAADVSSAYKAKNGIFATVAQIRDILSRDSTAQDTSASGHIGPMPDLDKAMKEISATTSGDITPPSTPQNLKAILSKQGKPVLAWSASTDNVKVSGYKVYRNGVYYTTVGATSFTDTSVSRRTTYKYQVQAIDTSGNNSALSAQVSITTR